MWNEFGLGVLQSSGEIWPRKRENNTRANPFYSPVPERRDKGGLLPLPSVYDYQYVLGHLTIEQSPNRP